MIRKLIGFIVILIPIVSNGQISVSISAADSIKKSIPDKGRMIVYFSKNSKQDPIRSFISDDLKNTAIRFGQDVEWNIEKPLLLSKKMIGFPAKTVNDLPAGEYNVQVIYDVDTTSYRIFVAPNLFSHPKKITITKKGKEVVNLVLDQKFPAPEFKDGKNVKYVSVDSKLLGSFWKRKVTLHASVMLPPDYDPSGAKKYPVVLNIGGYGSSCRGMERYNNDSNYARYWKDNDNAMLVVVLDSDAPYGDSYQMNSENNGPYMDALTKELIPAIENKYNAAGTAASRFLTGGSTGGWVSFALQVFNPDFFNGCWSFYADPVDFNFFQLVNIYKDENAFTNKYGYDNPSMRTVYDEPMLSIRHEVTEENTIGRNSSFVFSGDQWGGWNAVYSPRGKDGKPMAIWNPDTGKIDSSVAQRWKKWDLRQYLHDNWSWIGPKLQGKLHIWMGDMDTYYLNDAMRLMQAFLDKTENPKSDAQLTFGPMQVHGWQPLSRAEMMKQMYQRFEQSKKGF